MKKFLCFISVAIMLFVSCHSMGTIDEVSNPVYLTDEYYVALLPTSSFTGEAEILQLIEGNYGGKEYIMQTIVILNPEEISVSAFSPMGNSVYNLQYRRGKALYDAIMDFPESSAPYMLADIQFCYYPEEDVKRMIESSGLGFDSTEAEGGWVRTIFDGGETVIEITRMGNKLEYVNRLRQYEYRIEEL